MRRCDVSCHYIKISLLFCHKRTVSEIFQFQFYNVSPFHCIVSHGPYRSPAANKMFLPRSLVNIQYCGEFPSPRGSGLGPQGSNCQILCLEGSVISFISPYSGASPGPVAATRLPCARHTPIVRPALEQQSVTVLFFQLNP